MSNLCALLTVLLAAAPLFSAEGKTYHRLAVKAAEVERTLAGGKDIYLVLDLGERTLSLKAKGVVLRSWMLSRAGTWGGPIALDPVTLNKKLSFAQPKRPEIEPGDTENEGAADLQVLEVIDMPRRYSLIADTNIRLYIRARSRGISAALDFINRISRKIFLFPVLTIAAAASKTPFRAVEITLSDADEARALYWSAYQGIKMIVLPDFVRKI